MPLSNYKINQTSKILFKYTNSHLLPKSLLKTLGITLFTIFRSLDVFDMNFLSYF
jgi:hypothetical protein